MRTISTNPEQEFNFYAGRTDPPPNVRRARRLNKGRAPAKAMKHTNIDSNTLNHRQQRFAGSRHVPVILQQVLNLIGGGAE